MEQPNNPLHGVKLAHILERLVDHYGWAKALQIKGSSIASNPKIIELEWINKWNGTLPTYMLGSGQGIMLNMNNKN